MESTSSLFANFEQHLQHQPDAPLYRYLLDGDPGGPCTTWSYANTFAQAAAVAAFLREQGLTGKRALLLYPPGLEYIAGFFGCLMAGVVAVPAYPPEPSRFAQTVPRLVAIAQAARVDAVLTVDAVARVAQSVLERAGMTVQEWWTTDGLPVEVPQTAWLRPPSPTQLAYLQFTSGSTSDPKGVMITHGNIAHNSNLIRRMFGITSASRGVIWLPPYHDMGLVGGVIQPLYSGITTTLMSPTDFLKRPTKWIEAIARFEATVSGGPDFAYALCSRRFRPGKQPIDLSSWQVAFNGAEPIRKDNLERFAETFAPFGFQRKAIYPCYGLAEATLIVTGGSSACAPASFRASTDALEQARVRVAEGDEPGTVLVSCGTPSADQRLEIVDPQTCTPVAPGTIGELWLQGPSVAAGYFGRSEATQSTFLARLVGASECGVFMRTGDLGFLHEGELYVTGRRKDLIIVRGRNLYPQDLERTVEPCHPAIRAGGVVALSGADSEQPGVAIAAEVRNASISPLEEVAEAIRRVVTREHDVAVVEVHVLAPRALPKTSSGKLMRAACRRGLDDGSIAAAYTWRKSTEVVEASRGGRSAGEIRTWLRTKVAQLAAVPSSAIDPHRPLIEYGLDSEAAVELAGELEVFTAGPIAATLVWEYPSIEAIARHLAGERAHATAPEGMVSDENGDGRPPGGTARDDRSDAIAIIGMACRFPGGVIDPASLWALLDRGAHPIGAVPDARWIANDVPPASRFGGFVDDVDAFDECFFSISPREAKALDPQQRFLLEVAWEALDGAGLTTPALNRSATGVFIGLASNDYYRRQEHARAVDPQYAVTGNLASIAAGRVSHALGLVGPSLAVDTACSSSLMAIHLACQSLRAGECDQALAGGVNLMLASQGHLHFAQLQATSPRGRCATFDAEADGYVRSEGCALVVLKPLCNALRDGDRIEAVIRGSAVNHDGRSNGLTAPHGPSQTAVIRRALAQARLKPTDVGYVEAHGTGTRLGDPIELLALGEAFGEGRGEPLRVGSIKSNIGHAEAAAGVAGLLKAVLALQHERIPANLHFTAPNPHVPWDGLPLEVVAEPTPWPRTTKPRVAGISSFGLSGTNVHILVEEAPPSPVRAAESPLHRPRLIVAAAHRPEALRRRLADVRDLLDDDPDLDDLAGTLVSSSSHLSHRFAVVVRSCAELRALLQPSPVEHEPVTSVGLVFPAPTALTHVELASLARRWSVCARALEACEDAFGRVLGAGHDSFRGEATLHWQWFAYQYAVWALWRSVGLQIEITVGEGPGWWVSRIAGGHLDLRGAVVELVQHEARSTACETEPFEARMYAAMEALDLLVEVSPHRGAAGSREATILGVETPCSGEEAFLRAVAQVHVRGVEVDLRAVVGTPRRRVSLPRYPWQHSRHWVDLPATSLPDPSASPHRIEPQRARVLLRQQIELMHQQLSLLAPHRTRP